MKNKSMMDMSYDDLFIRNLGVFTSDEQKRIRDSRVVIIGDSGTGELLSTILVRCGVTKLIVAGEDTYVPSDMNRQIGCFRDTIGKNKVEVIRDTVLSINPDVQITEYNHLPAGEEMDRIILSGDIVIPAVDDLAYSVLLFRTARKHGVPAVLCLPSGTTGWVSVFRENSPTLEDMFGVPPLDYHDLVSVIRTKEYRCAQYNYVTSGDWRVDWFFEYFTGNRPLALICPVEWMAASLAAMEALKVLSGKWPAMEAPRCWYLKKGKVSASRFSTFIRYHRKLGWLIFGSARGKIRHKLTHLIWKKFFEYLR